MLMANSAAIITDAFPADQRGMALGINQVAGLAGSFIGLVLGGLLADWDWRAVFWVNVPIGIARHRLGLPLAARDRAPASPARIDWWGNLTFAVGLTALLVAITYGIQPYGGHTMGWTNPWVLGGLIGGVAAAGRLLPDRDAGRRADVPPRAVPRSAPSPPATPPRCSARSPAAACSSC